ATPQGLSWLRRPPEDSGRVRAWWTATLGTWSADRLEAARQVAVLPSPFRGSTARRVLGEARLDLRDLASPCNDAWMLHPSLREALLSEVSRAHRATLQ